MIRCLRRQTPLITRTFLGQRVNAVVVVPCYALRERPLPAGGEPSGRERHRPFPRQLFLVSRSSTRCTATLAQCTAAAAAATTTAARRWRRARSTAAAFAERPGTATVVVGDGWCSDRPRSRRGGIRGTDAELIGRKLRVPFSAFQSADGWMDADGRTP